MIYETFGKRYCMPKTRIAVASVLALICGYICFDAWDLVPGYFTLQEPANLAQPYPQLKNVKQKEKYPIPAMVQNAPIPDSTRVTAILRELAENPQMNGKISAIVADLQTNKILSEINPSRATTPASVNKLLTSTVALSVLKPNSRFVTTTKFADSTLYLVGGGDVLLAADKGEKTKIVGRAGLGDLARDTAKKLQTEKITKINLALDTALFSGESRAQGVPADSSKWVMSMSPIAMNQDSDNPQKISTAPKREVLEMFAWHLKNAGITVESLNYDVAPAKAQKMAQVESATVREIVDLTLLKSDNTLAEVLGHMVAVKRGKNADFQGAASAIKEELTALGFTTKNINLADSSGLSENNRITAILVQEIVQRIGKCAENSCASLLSALPIAKLDGTLANRFVSQNVGGKIRAKTGSLGSVTAMAGLLYTESGRLLSFVIMVDSVPNDGAYALRPLIDNTLAKIVAL